MKAVGAAGLAFFGAGLSAKELAPAREPPRATISLSFASLETHQQVSLVFLAVDIDWNNRTFKANRLVADASVVV